MRHFIIIVSTLVIIGCSRDPIPPEIVGNFVTNGLLISEQKLSLNELGAFHLEKWHASCFDSDVVDVMNGSFTVKENWIILKPETLSRRHYEGNIRERRIVQDSTLTIDELSSFNDSIYILRWDRQVYLLGGNNPDLASPIGYYNSPLLEFLNLINTDIHKTKSGREHLKGAYWNRECSTCTETDLRKTLPGTWADFILDSPIITKTIETQPILEDNNIDRYMITINSGTEQGVRRGMEFYSNSDCPYGVNIIEVYPNYSKGISYNRCEPKLGVVLSTFTEKR